jgi:hypothetical protein
MRILKYGFLSTIVLLMSACSSCDNEPLSVQGTEMVEPEAAAVLESAETVDGQPEAQSEVALSTKAAVSENLAEASRPVVPERRTKQPVKKASSPRISPTVNPEPVKPEPASGREVPVETEVPKPVLPTTPVEEEEAFNSPPEISEKAQSKPSVPEVVVAPSPPRRILGSGGPEEPPVVFSKDPVTAEPKKVTLPAGSVIEIRTVDKISSRDQVSGDLFEATLNRGIVFDGKEVIQRGSPVRGRLLEVLRAGKVKGRAAVTFDLKEMSDGDTTYQVQTNPITIEAESSKGKDLAKVGAATAIGAVLGAVLGGKKGAAIGGAAGGGAGTTGVLLSRGEEVEIPAERLLSFRLEQDLILEVR